MLDFFREQARDAAKFRAVGQRVDYETFKNMVPQPCHAGAAALPPLTAAPARKVSVAHLRPLQAPNLGSGAPCPPSRTPSTPCAPAASAQAQQTQPGNSPNPRDPHPNPPTRSASLRARLLPGGRRLPPSGRDNQPGRVVAGLRAAARRAAAQRSRVRAGLAPRRAVRGQASGLPADPAAGRSGPALQG